jgi:hypothetical protein
LFVAQAEEKILFYFFFPEIEEKILSELALGPILFLKRNLIFNDRKTSFFNCKVHCRLGFGELLLLISKELD